MSEQAAEGTVTEPAEGQQPPAEGQDSTDWKAEARKWQARAKENKSAADELAQYRQSQMSEAEKTAARLAEAERSAEEARREALRFRIATRFKVSDDDAELFLTGADEETLTRQAERLAARQPDPTRFGNVGQGPREPVETAPSMNALIRRGFRGA